MVTIGFWQCLDFQNNKDYFFNNKKENILGEDPIETLKSIFFFKNFLSYYKRNYIKNKFKKN